MSDAPTCRRCNAPIVFVASATTGKPIPCDPTPVAIIPVAPEHAKAIRATPIVSGVTEAGQVVRGIAPGDGTPPQAITMIRISHFATCPHADEFRKSKGRR